MGDDNENAPRRSSRRSVRNRYRVPSAEHFVGYVADNETPEMIMRKFEELERVMQSTEQPTTHAEISEPGSHAMKVNELDESLCQGEGSHRESSTYTKDQMERLFNATSAFSVREAFTTDAHDDEYLPSDVDKSDVDFEMSGEESESDFWDEDLATTTTTTKKRNGILASKNHKHGQTHRLQGKQGNVVKSKRPARDLAQFHVPPPPIPPSWGRTIQPFGTPLNAKRNEAPWRCLHLKDIATISQSPLQGTFLAVMINPGWVCDEDYDRSIQRLELLPIVKLCPEGFVFIWIHKTYLQKAWRVLGRWGFVYVENLTWIQLQPNNKVQQREQDTSIFPQSHLTLYIFRRGGKDIEIRHQRSSDVIFDVFDPESAFRPPIGSYDAIETLLPNSDGQLLELWSTDDAQRPGWIHVFEGDVM